MYDFVCIIRLFKLLIRTEQNRTEQLICNDLGVFEYTDTRMGYIIFGTMLVMDVIKQMGKQFNKIISLTHF